MVEIVLAEDNDADAELIARALSKGHVINRVVRVRDGVEALDFVFRTGEFSARPSGNPKLILLDLKMPRLGGNRGPAASQSRPARATVDCAFAVGRPAVRAVMNRIPR